MWLSKYFVYFVIFSCMGWIYESIYCTLRAGKWENRGFLYGPLCPIYGAGGVGITIIYDLIAAHGDGGNFKWWQIFLVAFFGSIVLEYVTSWTLEKLFHAYWWDYHDKPLNINGRVCFFYSLGFGVAGLLVIYYIAPFTRWMTGWISPILYELFGLIFMALVAIDTTLTVSALTDFSHNVVSLENSLNKRMDEFFNGVFEKKALASERIEDRKLEAAQAVEAAKQNAETRRMAEKARQEERERLSRENIAQLVDSMGMLRKSALKRVKGYRHPKVEKSHMEFFFNELEDRLNRRRNK